MKSIHCRGRKGIGKGDWMSFTFLYENKTDALIWVPVSKKYFQLVKKAKKLCSQGSDQITKNTKFSLPSKK